MSWNLSYSVPSYPLRTVRMELDRKHYILYCNLLHYYLFTII